MIRRSASFALVALFAAVLPVTTAYADPPAKPTAPAAAAKTPAAGLTAEQIAERVQGFYDRSHTFRAGFKQQYRVRAYDKTIDSQGQVVFEKPGKMSWRYTNNGNRVVSDGKLVKVYEKENKQMYEQPLDKSQYPAALSFLVGGGNLKQSFKFTKRDSKQMGFEGGDVIVGDPLEASPSYQSIILYVDAGTYQVRRVLLLDAQGNRNRFDFLNPEINTKTPGGEFTFTPPPGTQVIRPYRLAPMHVATAASVLVLAAMGCAAAQRVPGHDALHVAPSNAPAQELAVEASVATADGASFWTRASDLAGCPTSTVGDDASRALQY